MTAMSSASCSRTRRGMGAAAVDALVTLHKGGTVPATIAVPS